MIVVVMGVCGCGKTTVGQALAQSLRWEFLDADDFHPEQNKTKMSQGMALTDKDRVPWLECINAEMRRLHELGRSAVVACSALKLSYRHILHVGFSDKAVHARSQNATSSAEDASPSVWFVHLDGSFDLISSRMSARRGHFMPTSLLTSQLATLEKPAPPEQFISVDISAGVEEIVPGLLARLGAATVPTSTL